MKTYVLNLYDAHIRRQSTITEFQKQRIPVELFYGVNNNLLKVINPKVFLSTGAVGAYLSHLVILQNALNQPEDLVLIVEDDIVLVENFISRLNVSMQHLKDDWDIIFLGWGEGMNTKGVGDKSQQWIKLEKPLGMYAYIVKKASIPKLIFELNTMVDHIDKQIASAINAGRVNGYWIKEKLVTCNDFDSQIKK